MHDPIVSIVYTECRRVTDRQTDYVMASTALYALHARRAVKIIDRNVSKQRLSVSKFDCRHFFIHKILVLYASHSAA